MKFYNFVFKGGGLYELNCLSTLDLNPAASVFVKSPAYAITIAVLILIIYKEPDPSQPRFGHVDLYEESQHDCTATIKV